MKPLDIAYIATIAPVRELILAGSADLAYWRQRLAAVRLFPHDDSGRAAVSISAIAGRFTACRSARCPWPWWLAKGTDGRRAIYLAGAFNSSRPLAWAERAFFRTPYQLADIRLVSRRRAAAVTVAGQVVYRAERRAAGRTAAARGPDVGRAHLPAASRRKARAVLRPSGRADRRLPL
jgi:hypothetical protein